MADERWNDDDDWFDTQKPKPKPQENSGIHKSSTLC